MRQKAVPQNRVWNVAMYIRISNSDGNEESESIANQREIITQHILNFNDGDIYKIIGEYVDDGISGTTDENRTGFQKLLADIRKGFINCVVVKDLARSFRNYSDQGYYLDEWFPRYNVRFISLYHQALDTYKDAYNVRNIMIPIQGILNENYSAELSVKVRMAKEAQRKRGEYIGNWGVYGYVRNPDNKHQLIVDSESAEVVKAIYGMFLGGMTRSAIVRYLNENHILCPSEYRKKILQLNYHSHFAEQSTMPLWTSTTVTSILKNRTYCGDLVQGKERTQSYKLGKMERVPEDEWVIVPNTHEAIIDRDMYEKTQRLLQDGFRPKPEQKSQPLYTGLLYCGDCGKTMVRAGAGKQPYYYYVCNTYRIQSKELCTSHSIRSDRLDAAVLKAIQQQIYLVCEYEKMIKELDKIPVQKEKKEYEQKTLEDIEREISQNVSCKRKAYLDWKAGKLSRDEYHKLKVDYEETIEKLKAEADDLSGKAMVTEKTTIAESEVIQSYKKYKTITSLTREVLVQLAKKIEVYEENNIKITFLAQDELQKMQEKIIGDVTKT